MIYVLDRIEGDFAVFVGDDETILTLPAADFVEHREGDVFENEGDNLIFDEEATARRRAEIRERIKKLAKRKRPE